MTDFLERFVRLSGMFIVSVPYATFALLYDDEMIVREAAPMGKGWLGQSVLNHYNYYKSKPGAILTNVKDEK